MSSSPPVSVPSVVDASSGEKVGDHMARQFVGGDESQASEGKQEHLLDPRRHARWRRTLLQLQVGLDAVVMRVSVLVEITCGRKLTLAEMCLGRAMRPSTRPAKKEGAGKTQLTAVRNQRVGLGVLRVNRRAVLAIRRGLEAVALVTVATLSGGAVKGSERRGREDRRRRRVVRRFGRAVARQRVAVLGRRNRDCRPEETDGSTPSRSSLRRSVQVRAVASTSPLLTSWLRSKGL